MRFITVRISSLTILPSGMPVHAATISATTWPSTCIGIMGASPLQPGELFEPGLQRSKRRIDTDRLGGGMRFAVSLGRRFRRSTGATSRLAGRCGSAPSLAASTSRIACGRRRQRPSTAPTGCAGRRSRRSGSSRRHTATSVHPVRRVPPRTLQRSSARRLSCGKPVAASRSRALDLGSQALQPLHQFTPWRRARAFWPSATLAQAVSSTLRCTCRATVGR